MRAPTAEQDMLATDQGMATAQYTVMIALSLLIFVLLANAVVVMYGRGVLRAAVDEGVRAGSRATAAAATCETRARAAVRDLLGGAMGAGITLGCAQAEDVVRATAAAAFPAWLPGVPDFHVRVSATAVKERSW